MNISFLNVVVSLLTLSRLFYLNDADIYQHFRQLLTQVMDKMREGLPYAGVMLEGTELNVPRKNGIFTSIEISHVNITGLHNVTFGTYVATKKENGDISYKCEMDTEKIRLQGMVKFSYKPKSEESLTIEKEKSFITKVKGSPLGFDVWFDISPDGEVTPTFVIKTRPFGKKVHYSTHIKRSSGEFVSCDRFINLFAHRKKYDTCMDIVDYIDEKLEPRKKFEKLLMSAIRRVLRSIQVEM